MSRVVFRFLFQRGQWSLHTCNKTLHKTLHNTATPTAQHCNTNCTTLQQLFLSGVHIPMWPKGCVSEPYTLTTFSLVCCSVLQCVAVCCSVLLQCTVAVWCCSVLLQCVAAVCCSVVCVWVRACVCACAYERVCAMLDILRGDSQRHTLCACRLHGNTQRDVSKASAQMVQRRTCFDPVSSHMCVVWCTALVCYSTQQNDPAIEGREYVLLPIG